MKQLSQSNPLESSKPSAGVIVKQLLGFRRAEILDHQLILPRIACYVQRGMTRAQTEEVPGQGSEPVVRQPTDCGFCDGNSPSYLAAIPSTRKNRRVRISRNLRYPFPTPQEPTVRKTLTVATRTHGYEERAFLIRSLTFVEATLLDISRSSILMVFLSTLGLR